MAWVAPNPARYAGQVVDTGHCVRLTQIAAGAPHTSRWARGSKVRGNPVAPGTAIATFSVNGRYENRTDGSSHAAIFVAEESGGLRVWDQWTGHPVAQRTIRWHGGQGKKSNDGDQFFVIEEAVT
jgi:hypothetical protein